MEIVLILIALGANLPSRFGKPEETLDASKRKLGELGIKVLSSSRIWATEPVPASSQPWYRNAVVCVQTSLMPDALLVLLRAIEEDFGRVRGEANASRVLDLDLIAYHDVKIESRDVIVPHPRMQGRGFVLFPLREIAPDWVHPVSGKSVGQLILELPAGEQVVQLLEEKAA